MAGLEVVREKWSSLKRDWERAPSDAGELAATRRRVSELKRLLLGLERADGGGPLVLVGVGGLGRGSPASSPQAEEAARLWRSLAELSLELAALSGGEEAARFEREMEALMDAYAWAAEALAGSPEAVSPKAAEMEGLRLMAFLAQGRFGHFHMALDRIPKEEQRSPALAWPIALEKSLSLGTYAEILGGAPQLPSRFFRGFWERLKETVRQQILAGFAAAYDSLHVDDARRLLFLPSQGGADAVRAMAAERGWGIQGSGSEERLLLAEARQASQPPPDPSQPHLDSQQLHLRRLLHYASLVESTP